MDEQNKEITMLRISMVEPTPGQPRRNFEPDALSSLAESIAESGVLQPILVRPGPYGFYRIIAGERRWRASRLAGLVEIPAIILDTDDFTAAKIAMIENLQREDLNPYEEALGYFEFMKQFSLTQEQVASHMGKSRSAIANSLRLLDLPEVVLGYLVDGKLSAAHARTLLGLSDKSAIPAVAESVIERGLSVREVESMVKELNKASASKKKNSVKASVVKVDYLADLEDHVRSMTGRQCRIINTPKRRVIQIEFADNDDLQDVLTTLCGKAPIQD